VFNIEQTFVSAGLTIAETFIYLKTSPLAEFSAYPAAFIELDIPAHSETRRT
jgi:hypothetical protein